MSATTPSSRSTIDHELVARVQRLGAYDPEGADEDHDRAFTRPSSRTIIELDDDWISIYSGQHGIDDAFLCRGVHGPLIEINAATAEAILDTLDALDFPTFPE